MNTWLPRGHDPHTNHPTPEGDASRGQVVIIFALFLTVLVGALGLATDLGFAFAQRRSMQNAADAGALAGARVVAKAKSSPLRTAEPDVNAVVNENAMELGTIGGITCVYVNDAGNPLANCNATVHPQATGVRVTVNETHPTFFMRAVPGASDTATTSASAMAHVKKVSMPFDGPFMPCGVNTKLPGGGTLDLLIRVDGVWKINPLALNRTFIIHAPQPEDCNAMSDRWKGLANGELNRNKTGPGWFHYVEGDTAGTIAEDVDGPDGCKAGQEVINCVAFLPIALPEPVETGNLKQLWVIAFAPFYITKPHLNSDNTHYGKLMADYMVAGKGESGDFGWDRGYTGPVTIRLTE